MAWNNDTIIEKKTDPVGSQSAEKVKYSDERIKDWLFGKTEKTRSNVCCGIYGFDGTAKSGIAIDCRTEQEKKDGMKIIIFDLDGGCGPLKKLYHDDDDTIRIKNPLVRDKNKNIDYEATFSKIKAALDFIERNIDDLKIKAVIFDGVDKFLKICEYCMRDVIGKSVEDGIDYRYWKMRNQKYNDIMEQIKLLDVDRFFITHYKKDGDENFVPDWEKKTPDMMFQKLRCYREQKMVDGNKIIYLKAEIEKCKTNLGLEGKVFTVAETIHYSNGNASAKWLGLIFDSNNKITQKGVDK